MIARILETLFRHKLLLLLPPLLIPLVVGPLAVATTPVYYETFVGVWVDKPSYVGTSESDWSNYLSPAQNQSNRLNELLRTRAFLLDVAARTPLAPLVGSERGEQRLRELINGEFVTVPSNNHLLVLRYRGATPQISYQVLNAIVETFKEKAATDRVDQANLASVFYENRLQTAEQNQEKATTELRRYVVANPHLTDPQGPDTQRVAIAAIDPQLAELQRRVAATQEELSRAHEALDQTRLQAAAALEGQELGFQVIDEPRVPTTLTRELRKRLILPAAGLLAGMALSGALFVLLLASDRTIRRASDLEPLVRVVGVLPRVRLKRVPKKIGADAARRAIGFIGGTALPAPGGGKGMIADPRNLATTSPDGLLPFVDSPRDWLLPGIDELFRGIYTRCGLGVPETIAITSAISGEGKTTLALGLAVTLAQDWPERQILLVETDIQRATITRDFDLEPGSGLFDCVISGEPLYTAYQDTFLSNLQVVPAGGPVPNASRVLRSSRMASAMDTMRETHDIVLLDLPSLLVSSDAILLTELADGLVMVVRAGVTPSSAVSKALEEIDQSKLRGVVLNGEQSSIPGWIRRLAGI